MTIRLILFLFALGTPVSVASQVTWTGGAGSDFETPGNWTALPANDLTSDTAAFAGVPTANQPALSTSRSLGGIVFSTPSGGWTLSGSNVLTLGASGISAAAQTGGVTTVSANVGVAATQTWQVGSGGVVRVTGSILAGESTTSGLAGQVIVGGTNAGDMILDPAPGRSVAFFGNLTSSGAVQVNQRLLLGSAANSTASVNTIYNAASAGLRISNTGVVEVRSGVWRTNDLGSNNTAAFTGRLVISGGTLATGGARYLGQVNGAVGTRVELTGGTLAVTGAGNVVANAGYLGLGAHGAATPTGTITFDVAGGVLEVARGAGTLPSGVSSAAMSLGGVANTTVLVNQSAGMVRVGVVPGSNVFTGVTNANAYTNLSVGSSLDSNRAAYTLTGGTLVVAGAIQGVASAGGLSNFNFVGGTLATGSYNATALGHSSTATPSANQVAESVSVGTLVNRGGTLAPGGLGTPGRTTITGNYSVQAGSLAVDLGGTTQATAFQSGQYDFLSVSGQAAIGGNLTVNVLSGFTPNGNQTFTILTASSLSGHFANAPHGTRIVSENGLHTFVVSQSSTSVSLGAYLAVVAPTISAVAVPEVIAPGDAIVLGVSASSLAPVTYEWRRDGQVISGATSGALTLPNFQPADAGLYEVSVRNAAGAATRSFSVRVNVPPSSLQAVVDVAASQTFTASPGASNYRWILDGEEVGTAATFEYSPMRRDVGTHWLRVVETYADGSKTTRHWTVRVRIPIPTSTTFLYVAPTGSDTNDGSMGSPFRTLEKARDTIRGYSGGQRASGVTVYLRGGVHRRTTTFTLSSQDSGAANAPIVYAAFPGESPVLTTTRVLAASNWAPLAASEHFRVAPGVDPTRIWETSVAGNARASAFPAIFNEWTIFNALRSSQNGGQMEVFANGERQRLSRYPNENPSNDTQTPNLVMNGVAAGAAVDGSGYLNGAGNYTLGAGGTVAVGGAFQYKEADAARVARWETALTRGGVWVAGYWRVPWQLNGVRVSVIDQVKKVIGLATNPSNANNPLVSNGIGDKYARPAGSKTEPWWVVNLLEEMDVPGEWAIDFSRQRLYLLMNRSGAPADGEVELSDLGSVLFQLNGASDVCLQGLTFQRHLGIAVQITNGGSRNLVLGCKFVQIGNMAVDILNGTENGVLSSDFEKLASGGVMLRGGSMNGEIPVPANHFAVNNKFRSFSEVVRVYQAAVDAGYGGPMGNWGLPTVGMRVAQNDIRTSPHAAILWNGHRHVIEYNEVSDFTRISNDLGAIYRFGRNVDFRTIIRYNHLFNSPLGEGVYNDMDHVRTPVYGNTINLKTPASASRGYGFWSNTHTTTGEANTSLPMGLQVYNNISVNTRAGFQFHSATGGRIENNVAFRPLTDSFRWFRITTNTSTNTHVVSSSNAATLQSGPNIGYSTDPGFVDYANDDLRLRPDAQVYRDMSGFDPIPLELAGNLRDETRTSGVRVWTPFVVTGLARSVGANTATFVGGLVYPQFDPNATVRLYWGTSDGGTDPALWDNVVNLGQPGAGDLAHTPTNLQPATRYFFRFLAENSAGQHWAERTNSTTTFPLDAVPTNGDATATSGASPQAAFDGNPATVWQTSAGTTAATLNLTLSGDPVRLTRYSVTSAPDSPEQDPRDWRLEGSLDGVSWLVLDTRTNVSFTARGQTLDFGFSNTGLFRFYRLVITANAGDPSLLKLAEVKFWSPAVTPDTVGPVITTPGNLVVSGNSSGATVTFEVSALDAISGVAPAVATPASGSFFPIGTAVVSVTATDTSGNTSTANFTITVQPPTLPSPWTIRQINPYTGVAAGTVTVNSATSFTINGSGGASTGGTTGDLWTGASDSNTYVSIPWVGDGVFTARLASFTSTDSSAKAGIILRETTNSGSRYSTIYMIRNNGGAVLFQHKTATNGSSTGTNFFNGSVTSRGIPEWIRLVRQGDTFSMFYSENGTTWTELGTPRTNAMSGSSLSVGFVVAPRTGNATASAVFDNISFLTPRQVWRQTNFGITANTGNAADSADPDGDGHSNLLEYALGSMPNSSSSRPLIEFGTLQIEPDPATFLELTFQRIADPVLTYRVEATSDLVGNNWSSIWESSGAANTAGIVTVTDTGFDISAGTPLRRFLRLRVSGP